MNKRHTGKLLAFLLAVVFMFTLVPQVFADGESADYFYVHDGSGAHDDQDWSNPDVIESFITIIGPNEVEIPSDSSGNYSDIPANASIIFQIGFHLSDGAYDDWKSGDKLIIGLPKGVSYPTGTGPDIMSGATAFATWEIVDSQLTVTLTGGIDSLNAGVFGVFGFSGTFEYLEDAGDGASETEIKFGDQTITITRKSKEDDPKPVEKSSVTKSHVEYDPSTGELAWEIKINPPDGKGDYDYSGFTLHDQLSGNHHYKADTFTVGGGDPITGTEVDYDADTKILKYTFPEGTVGPQTVRYVTKIESLDKDANGKILFSNVAQLKKGNQDASEKAPASYEMSGFFVKTGKAVDINYETGEAYIQWEVKVTLPKTQSVITLPDAQIIDILTGSGVSHDYYIDATKRVTITGPGFSESFDGQAGWTGSQGGTLSKTSGQLTYSFPNGQPKTRTTDTSVYRMIYYTKIQNWDENADSNASIKVTNKADFTWGHTGGSGVGHWEFEVGVEKEVIPSGGLISKSAVDGSAVYDHSAVFPDNKSDYIKWEITVNRNRIPMNGFTIDDSLVLDSPYLNHKLYIGTGNELQVFKNDDSSALSSFSVTHNDEYFVFTLTNNDSFTLTLKPVDLEQGEDVPDDQYRVVFYTKNDDLSKMYSNDAKTFRNGVSLTAGVALTGPVYADKDYELQMLKKSAGNYDYQNRTIRYTLEVNRNRLPLNSVNITEILPNDTVLWPESVNSSIPGDFKVYVNGDTDPASSDPQVSSDIGAGIKYTSTNDGFQLEMPNTVSGQPGDRYTIEYTVRVKDEALLKANNSFTLTLENNVKMESNDPKFSISDDTTTKPSYDTIKKEHDYITSIGGDLVNWTVEINPGLVDLQDAYVEDTLSEYLTLIESSVTLYEAAVNPGNGELVAGDLLDISSLFIHPVEDDEQHFRMNLPSGPKAYILKFSTLITANDKNISNIISMRGFLSDGDVESTSDPVVVADRFAYGGSTDYILKIRKFDENNEGMENVKFGLFKSDGTQFIPKSSSLPMEGQTDEDGFLIFENLPNLLFTVKEVEVPDGYLRALPLEGVRPTKKIEGDDGSDIVPIEIINKRALADVRLIKMNEAEDELDGGLFEIFDAQGKKVADSTSVNGEVLFEDLEIGNYTIIESQALMDTLHPVKRFR